MVNKELTKANILSFDIEEWFQVSNFGKRFPVSQWDALESRVEIGVDYILDTLHLYNIKATFFIVGWVAERHCEMVKRINAEGHEIGVHGYMHKNITNQTPKSFAKDLEKAIKIVTDITGNVVRGYRAPSYTITPKTSWAFDILNDHGIEFDSSLYPIKGHPTYGFPSAPCYPFLLNNGLYEFPMSTFKIGSNVIPFGSGGYFRHLPYSLTRFILKTLNRTNKFITINIHPWELDPEREIEKISLKDRFQHYHNISVNRKKFVKLLSHFKFISFTKYIKHNKFPLLELKNGIFKLLQVVL